MIAKERPCIYIVSGGSGASGEQVVNTVLAQFQQSNFHVVTISNLRTRERIDTIISEAAEKQAVVVVTLVDDTLNLYMIAQAREHGVVCIDLMRELLDHVSAILGVQPAGHPGLYRKLHRDYFERVAAIEYTLAHDDGKDPAGWGDAEIILIGLSRVGKTPLSLYLSVLGWKVANIPIVMDLDIHPAMYELDTRRVIALVMHPGQLLTHRRLRMERMGLSGTSRYAQADHVKEEIELMQGLITRLSVICIDVTDAPIETSADRVMRVITRRFGEKVREI
jgi:[pyruvate, water dikinase]-phosphate phosphotransferase / [pyruvate, water dikinase] kinase